MTCEDGVCAGTSGNNQQCFSTPCRDGYGCNKYKQCVDCPKEGWPCIDSTTCCDGLVCAIGPKDSRACKKYREPDTICYPKGYSICCGDDYNCIAWYNGSVCVKCSITTMPCLDDFDCFYGIDFCDEDNTCKKKGGFPTCTANDIVSAIQAQDCRLDDGTTIECCNGITCSGIGVCEC